MDKQKKTRLLDRLVDQYCIKYLKSTKNGSCDGKCPFQGMCSTDYIRQHPRKVENIFERIKQARIEEMKKEGLI